MVESKEPTWRSLSEVVGRVLSSLPAPAQEIEMVPSREGRLQVKLDGRDSGRPRGRRIQRTTGMSKAASRNKVLRRGATTLDAPATLVQHECVTSDNTTNGETNKMFPRHLNSVQWEQALGYARQACARIFRDGGSPSRPSRRSAWPTPMALIGAPRLIALPRLCVRRSSAKQHEAVANVPPGASVDRTRRGGQVSDKRRLAVC